MLDTWRHLTAPNRVIKDPSICLKVGASVVFDVDSANKNYPIYDRNSLLNSNDDFDYGPFLDLKNEIESGTTISQFLYTFKNPGVYVFKINDPDGSLNERSMIIGVMSENKRCDDEDAFIQPLTEKSLLLLGAYENDDIVYDP